MLRYHGFFYYLNYLLTPSLKYIKIEYQQQERVMKKLIIFVLVLHVLPLFVLGWVALLDLSSFSSMQWGIAWFMTSASAIILANQQFFWSKEYDAKK